MSSELKKRNIPFSPPDMTEAEANEVRDAILSGWITTGPRTKELERTIEDFVGIGIGVGIGQETAKAKAKANVAAHRCVCLNSATAAMEMALHLLGVGPGDEVIVPAYTYTATASVVLHVGATPVFVDIQKDCPEMDYDKLAEAITERTKVISPVDLGGIVADLDKVFAIVEAKKGLFRPKNEIQKRIGRIAVSSDCAHSFGAQRHGKMAGSIADFSSFSFHAVKNFTTAEGGALCWHLPFGGEPVVMDADSTVPAIEGETWDGYLYRLSQLYSLHGQNKDALAKTKLGAWEYDIIGPWYKCNMTDIMAGLGLAQFKRYPGMLARRREIIERYDAAFAPLGVVGMRHYGADWAGSGHLYICRLPGYSREQTSAVITAMAERGIACNVHYKPLPMMTAYKSLGVDIADYPNAYAFFENELTLPLHTRLSDDDIEYIIKNLTEILKG